MPAWSSAQLIGSEYSCRASGLQVVTAANGVVTLPSASVALPSAGTWYTTPSTTIISPSRWSNVPRPKSPWSSRSSSVTAPS